MHVSDAHANDKRRAAPHCPIGHFSLYSDGRKTRRGGFRECRRNRIGACLALSSFLPVTIRGEGGGRRMRGSAKPWR
ncbi:hypothetical protein C7I87_21455 [Mesorhizobium sp. SARCC-RB16n]|nr:hypothetical protein C7I87_21455 [Mesorhizobium sp. SARCC-RB16n]